VRKLAVNGGKPVRSEPYPPWPYFWEEEKQAVREVLDSGKVNYWTGFRGMEFQKRWAQYCGVKHAIALNSGTSALHVAVAAAGIGPGDEVICPSYTFIGTAAAVLHQNAVPIFVDVDARTYNIDPAAAKAAITPKTKAIVAVHLHGHPAEMGPLLDLAKKHNIVVIEDAAQAHGAEYKGRKIGSIGHLAAFSFCQDKIITTGGEGGMVTTDNDDFAEIGRSFKDHGYWEEEHKDLLQMEALYPYIHHRMGFNYRMTEMQSVIGMVCLNRLDTWVEKRRENAHYLTERIKQIPHLEPPYEAPHVKHAFYKYAFTIKPDALTCSRDDFVRALRAEGIPCLAGVPPSNQMEEVFQKHAGYGSTECPFACPWYGEPPDYGKMNTPVAEKLGARTVWLLVHPTVGRKDLEDAAAALEKVAGAYAA
jgi:dTDP-4-amino-4,6-dideoxygalactose transaminase